MTSINLILVTEILYKKENKHLSRKFKTTIKVTRAGQLLHNRLELFSIDVFRSKARLIFFLSLFH